MGQDLEGTRIQWMGGWTKIWKEPGLNGWEDGPRTGHEPGLNVYEDVPRSICRWIDPDIVGVSHTPAPCKLEIISPFRVNKTLIYLFNR